MSNESAESEPVVVEPSESKSSASHLDNENIKGDIYAKDPPPPRPGQLLFTGDPEDEYIVSNAVGIYSWARLRKGPITSSDIKETYPVSSFSTTQALPQI